MLYSTPAQARDKAPGVRLQLQHCDHINSLLYLENKLRKQVLWAIEVSHGAVLGVGWEQKRGQGCPEAPHL